MIGNENDVLDFLIKNEKHLLFEIKVKREKSIRTLAQNKYYFGCILETIMDFIGLQHKFEKIELHKQIKDYFELETTTDLDTKEFAKICNEIRAWYLDNRGLYIPLPNEVEELKSLEAFLF